MTLLAVVVRDAGNQAPGVVLQLLARSAHGHNPPLVPGQVVLILHTAAHAIQALEQPAIGVILSESMSYLTTGKWWLAMFPGLSLVLVVVLFAAMGEQLRKLLDPASVHM